MKGSPRVLVLGAGPAARPTIEYLHGHGAAPVVAARLFAESVRETCLARGVAMETFRLEEGERLAELVGEAAIVVSLLPARHLAPVARACLAARRPLVAAGEPGVDFHALDAPAREAGVLLLAGCGLAPGILEMGAARIVHEVRKQGGEVTALHACRGLLPAPEANDNPFYLKFDGNARCELLAARLPARCLRRGEPADVPAGVRFAFSDECYVEGVGMLEASPDGDALALRDTLDLPQAADLFRGVLHYPGHGATWLGFARLGLLEPERAVHVSGLSWRGLVLALNPGIKRETIEEDVARITGNAVDSEAFARYRWLGLLDETPVGGTDRPPLDCLADLLTRHLAFAPGDPDMLLVRHAIEARFPERRYRIVATLAALGDPDGDLARNRAAGLPAAAAAKHILAGHIRLAGAHRPARPEFFGPILSELERLGLRFEESIDSLDGEPDTEFGGDLR